MQLDVPEDLLKVPLLELSVRFENGHAADVGSDDFEFFEISIFMFYFQGSH